MVSRSFYFSTALLGCLLAQVDSFFIGPHQTQQRSLVQQDFKTTTSSILKQQMDDDDDEELVVVTPNQIKFLRKEASKRSARKQVPRFFLQPEETLGPFSDETLAEIGKALDENELVEVRSIAKDHKRQVFSTAEMLAATLEMDVMNSDEDSSGDVRPVVLLSTKGFSAIFYCPMADDSNPNKIVLRTSYKKNQWTRKEKPERDNRGQIIKD